MSLLGGELDTITSEDFGFKPLGQAKLLPSYNESLPFSQLQNFAISNRNKLFVGCSGDTVAIGDLQALRDFIDRDSDEEADDKADDKADDEIPVKGPALQLKLEKKIPNVIFTGFTPDESKIVVITRDCSFLTCSVEKSDEWAIDKHINLSGNIISVKFVPKIKDILIIQCDTTLYKFQFNDLTAVEVATDIASFDVLSSHLAVLFKNSTIKLFDAITETIDLSFDLPAGMKEELGDEYIPVAVNAFSHVSFLVVFGQPITSDTEDVAYDHKTYYVTFDRFLDRISYHESFDITPAFGTVLRNPSYYHIDLKSVTPQTKDVHILASSCSSELTIISDCKVIQPSQDSDRAVLPINQDTDNDTNPVGIALDISTAGDVVQPCSGVDRAKNLPLIYVLNNEGVLQIFALFHASGIKSGEFSMDATTQYWKDSMASTKNSSDPTILEGNPFPEDLENLLKKTNRLSEPKNSTDKVKNLPDIFKTTGMESFIKDKPPTDNSDPVSTTANPFSNTNSSSPFANVPKFSSTAFDSSAKDTTSHGSGPFGKPTFGNLSLGEGTKPIAGQPTFASLSEGKKATPAFGTPAFGQTGFDKPATTNATATTEAPSFGKLAFGQTGFGPFAQSTNSSPAFSKPSFGQIDTDSKGNLTPGLGASGSAPFGSFNPSQKDKTDSPFAAFANGKSPFAQVNSGQSPFAEIGSKQSPFGQYSSGQSPFSQAGSNQSPFAQATPGQSPFAKLEKASLKAPFTSSGSTNSPFFKPSKNTGENSFVESPFANFTTDKSKNAEKEADGDQDLATQSSQSTETPSEKNSNPLVGKINKEEEQSSEEGNGEQQASEEGRNIENLTEQDKEKNLTKKIEEQEQRIKNNKTTENEKDKTSQSENSSMESSESETSESETSESEISRSAPFENTLFGNAISEHKLQNDGETEAPRTSFLSLTDRIKKAANMSSEDVPDRLAKEPTTETDSLKKGGSPFSGFTNTFGMSSPNSSFSFAKVRSEKDSRKEEENTTEIFKSRDDTSKGDETKPNELVDTESVDQAEGSESDVESFDELDDLKEELEKVKEADAKTRETESLGSTDVEVQAGPEYVATEIQVNPVETASKQTQVLPEVSHTDVQTDPILTSEFSATTFENEEVYLAEEHKPKPMKQYFSGAQVYKLPPTSSNIIFGRIEQTYYTIVSELRVLKENIDNLGNFIGDHSDVPFERTEKTISNVYTWRINEASNLTSILGDSSREYADLYKRVSVLGGNVDSFHEKKLTNVDVLGSKIKGHFSQLKYLCQSCENRFAELSLPQTTIQNKLRSKLAKVGEEVKHLLELLNFLKLHVSKDSLNTNPFINRLVDESMGRENLLEEIQFLRKDIAEMKLKSGDEQQKITSTTDGLSSAPVVEAGLRMETRKKIGELFKSRSA